MPSQVSAGSQGPAEGRQVAPFASFVSVHEVELPEHTSSTSQGPAAARHTVPALPGPLGKHLGTPEEQSVLPSSQGLPVLQGALGVQVLAQVPAPSQKPPLQALPMATKASMGQLLATPLQTSATSQADAAARQISPEARRASSGQAAAVPSQTSSASQSPVAARHEVPAAARRHHFKTGEASTREWRDKDDRFGLTTAYDRTGQEIFRFGTRRIGGHACVHFSYHANGGISKAEASDAPDAGIQWFRSTTTFDDQGNQTGYWKESHEDLLRPSVILWQPEQPLSPVVPQPPPTVVPYQRMFVNEVFVVNGSGWPVEITVEPRDTSPA